MRLIVDLRPDAILVTPSYALAIADEFARQGLDARDSSLSVGIHGAEPWTEPMRREIEQRFGMHAVDIYGLSEVIGPGVASECVETKDGLHIWEDHFYPEIIDPVTGAVLPDGETGELVFTTLTKEAQPLVRYRTRDLTLGDPRLSAHYQLELRRDGRLDELTVVSELKLGATDATPELDAIGAAISARIKGSRRRHGRGPPGRRRHHGAFTRQGKASRRPPPVET